MLWDKRDNLYGQAFHIPRDASATKSTSGIMDPIDNNYVTYFWFNNVIHNIPKIHIWNTEHYELNVNSTDDKRYWHTQPVMVGYSLYDNEYFFLSNSYGTQMCLTGWIDNFTGPSINICYHYGTSGILSLFNITNDLQKNFTPDAYSYVHKWAGPPIFFGVNFGINGDTLTSKAKFYFDREWSKVYSRTDTLPSGSLANSNSGPGVQSLKLNNGQYTGGYLTDLRWYSVNLSDADFDELAQRKIIITKTKKIICNEFIEAPAINFTGMYANGCMMTKYGEFIEGSSYCGIGKNGNIYADEIIEK